MVKIKLKEITILNGISLLAGLTTLYGFIYPRVIKTSSIGLEGAGDVKLWVLGAFVLVLVWIIKKWRKK